MTPRIQRELYKEYNIVYKEKKENYYKKKENYYSIKSTWRTLLWSQSFSDKVIGIAFCS